MEVVPSKEPRLAEYLTRHLTAIYNELSKKDSLQKQTALPVKPQIGKLYYFTVIPSTVITTEGVWVYKPTGWSYLG